MRLTHMAGRADAQLSWDSELPINNGERSLIPKLQAIAKHYLLALLFCALFALGRLLLGPNQPLDAFWSFRQVSGVFCIFLSWLASLLLWGSFFARLLKLRNCTHLLNGLLGSFFFVSIPFLGSFIGIFGDRHSWVYFAFLFVPFIFSPKYPAKKARLSYEVILPALFLLVVVLLALVLNPYQDVYDYQLYGPWRWWREGKIFFAKDFPLLLQASVWEYLNAWGFALFGSEGSALYAAQIFAQLVHAVVGMGGFILAFNALAQHFEIHMFWRSWGALLLAGSTNLLWTAWHVKNDFGGLFWLSMGFYLLLEGHAIGLGFFVLGMAVASKFSLALPLVFFLLGLSFYAKDRSKYLRYLPFLLLPLLPLLWRNYALTTNPVFPFLSNFFAPLLSKTGNIISLEKNGVFRNLEWTSTTQSFLSLLKAAPLIGLVIAALPFVLWQKKKIFYWSLLGIAGIFAGVLLMGPVLVRDPMQGRLLVTYLVMPVLALAALFDKTTQTVSLNMRYFIFVAAAIAALSALPWRALPHLPFSDSAFEIVRQRLPGGDCKMWVTTQLPADAKIVSLEEDAMYLMPEGRYFSAFQNPEIDNVLFETTDIANVLLGLKELGLDFILQNIHPLVSPYYKGSPLLWEWMLKHPEAIAFKGHDCLVFSLHR